MEISGLRDRIDKIDKELIRLFEERMDIVTKIARYKLENNLSIYDPDREQQVIRKAVERLDNKKYDVYAKEFFEDLMKVSKKLQEKLIPSKNKPEVNLNNRDKVIGYQGIPGSYGEAAVISLFGENSIRKETDSFEGVFKSVIKGEIHEGVIPLENSSTGGLNDVFDLLREYDLYITGETKVKIDHCLLGLKGSTIEDIKRVYSHPQALKQCSNFFKNHLHITPVEYSNTATAAKDILSFGKKENGAVASRRAAEIFKLDILSENIQDWDQNSTRFISIGKQMSEEENINKTSILFTTRHVPGALYRILKPLYENEINISKIESRPNIKRSFEYFFYIDIEASIHDIKVVKALEEVKNNCGYFRILGSYYSKI